MNKPLIVGNWKMNTSCEEAIALATAVAQQADRTAATVDVGVCPPYPWLVPVQHAVKDTALQVGAQDCAATDNGAFTGDVSAAMLASCCTFTLVGHSERRSIHHESDAIVQRKLRQAILAGLNVILCVGESGEEREAGHAEQVVTHQLAAALEEIPPERVPQLAIAYEPVWAIGTGKAATADDAAQMATAIRNDMAIRFGPAATTVRILYGGSANDRNAGDFLTASNVDGLLVGGASLSAETFGAMIRRAPSIA